MYGWLAVGAVGTGRGRDGRRAADAATAQDEGAGRGSGHGHGVQHRASRHRIQRSERAIK